MIPTGGPVPLGSSNYVEREFETQVTAYLHAREWVLLLGPRQHGKTSALVRIRRSLQESGLRCAFVDLQGQPPRLGFRELLAWFTGQVCRSLGTQLVDPPTDRRDSIEDWLDANVAMPGAPLIIIIDEASSIRDDEIRNSFYGQVRAIKSAAAAAGPEKLSTVLQFVFSGTFRPESLVDERNSPFNVCRRVETEDISPANIRALAATHIPEADVDRISTLILERVGGQPFLAQSLLAVAITNPDADPDKAINIEVERLIVEGSDHLDSLFRTVIQDAKLMQIASLATKRGFVQNDPANADFKFASVLGLMRRDEDKLVFRNDLYKRVSLGSPQLSAETQAAAEHFSRLYHKEENSFAFLGDAELREIALSAYNGAVSATNTGSYRLALVGFGMVLESVLIDWLSRQTAPDIANAVAAATNAANVKSLFNRHEDQNDPSTWRLVNLMKVARQFNKVRGALELPEALRDMRNFAHPAVIKARYLHESNMRPEAIAASGLVDMVMRDIQLP
jgi:hypothetical protein